MNSDYLEEHEALMEAADAVAALPDEPEDYSDEPPIPASPSYADYAAADWWAWRTR